MRVLDDFSSGREANLEAAARLASSWCAATSATPRVLRALRTASSVVFHQGAMPSVPRSVAEPLRTHERQRRRHAARARGGAPRGRAARGVRGFVVRLRRHAGAAQGRDDAARIRARPTRSRSGRGEAYCRLYHELYGLETVALRYFNVFGPRQDPESEYAAVVPRFATAVPARRAARSIYGDGEQTRDFTFVEDAVRANLLAADAPGAAGRGDQRRGRPAHHA